MAFSLLAHTSVAGLNSPQTTGAIDTTGANLLIVAVSSLSGTTTVTDSKSNTWTKLTIQSAAGISTQLHYCVPSSVGAGHTFTSTGIFAGDVMVQAWSGATATPFDVENGATAPTTTSLATGSITPTANNYLVVSALCASSGVSITVNSGLTISDNVPFSSGVNEGGAMAYIVQGSAAPINPTWSWTTSSDSAAVIASFKAAAGGGGSKVPLYMLRAQQGLN